MPSHAYSEDIDILQRSLVTLPVSWEGREAVLQLKDANYHWKQMEWLGFYFEWLAFSRLRGLLQIPGDRYGSTTFDLKHRLNWDLKSKAINNKRPYAILNDCTAMDWSVATFGEHGTVIALCEVEYDDVSRSFQEWQSELKGGLSRYEINRRARTSKSTLRKTRAVLKELVFLRFDASNVGHLRLMRQGQNSNGRPRPLKYKVNVKDLSPYLEDRIVF